MPSKHTPEPLIWLQCGEDEGTADCGCRLHFVDEIDSAVTLCPTHAVAPALLEACKLADDALRHLCNNPAFGGDAPEFNVGGIGYDASQVLKSVIAAAKGGA